MKNSITKGNTNNQIIKRGEKERSRFTTTSGSIGKKKSTKIFSKKKQRALAKSSKVMIEKMNSHTTEDDIVNIIMSVETQTDTRAVKDNNDENKEDTVKKSLGLRSLMTDQLKNDREKDKLIQKREAAVQNDIAEQLKLIDDFSL